MSNDNEQLTQEQLKERLDKILTLWKGSENEKKEFSREMNLNLAQFNMAQVVIFASIILNEKSFRNIYAYIVSSEYGQLGTKALTAGHNNDDMVKMIAGFRDETRKMLNENNGVVTPELKWKIISLTSINFLLDAVNLIYKLLELPAPQTIPIVANYANETNIISRKGSSYYVDEIENAVNLLSTGILEVSEEQINELQDKLTEASAYCLGIAKQTFDAMTKDRKEKSGIGYATPEYLEYNDKIALNLNNILGMKIFNDGTDEYKLLHP